MSTRTPISIRSLVSIALTLIVLSLCSLASATGRVEWKGRSFKEREDKAWRLEVAIYMPHAPDVPHVPMKFEFQPEVYYERDMMDGDKLVERKVPLENRQALIESVDVGFLDSGSGKIEPRTRFTFKLTRAHGYEAGEYKVSIHDGRNDQAVGSPVTLTFLGDNEIIDRRAMVFSGNDKKKKDAEPKKQAEDESASDEKKTGDDRAGTSSDAPHSHASDAPKGDEKPSDAAGTIKEKPGGCGCRLAETNQGEAAGLTLSLLALSCAWRRRGRSRVRVAR